MSENEKWAANVAFVGDEKTVKKILKKLDSLEDKGEIEDLTGIEGPFDSLQLMLKRRVDNLALEASSPADQAEPNSLASKIHDQEIEETEDDWFEDDEEWRDDDEEEWLDEENNE